MVYDNIVMVGHAHILSIFNMNAKINKEKSWRHVTAPYEQELDESEKNVLKSEIMKDPFK